MKKQSGFATVELVLLAVIVAAIAGVGYYVIKNHNTGQSTAAFINAETSTSAPVTTPPVPQVNTTADLTTAFNTLSQTSIGANSNDSSQLTTQSSGL